MESGLSWFTQGPMAGIYKPGSIVVTHLPTRREWFINDILKGDANQQTRDEVHDEGLISYASILLSCSPKDNRGASAFMRVNLQIPYTDTEFDTADHRGQQARPVWKSDEFLIYRKMTSHKIISEFTPNLLGWDEKEQKRNGWVPGGFHFVFIWERIHGVRLGAPTTDLLHASPFWRAGRPERDLIRTQFKSQYVKMRDFGILPTYSSLNNLVWDQRIKRLYWINFEYPNITTKWDWSDHFFAIWDLAIPPDDDDSWVYTRWNGDVSKWQF